MERKSPSIEALLDSLSLKIAKPGLGMSRSSALEKQRCAQCGGKVSSFRDETSAREYLLTAWCQACQDEYFDSL